MRSALVTALLLLGPTAARADQLLTLDSTISAGGLDHERVPFEVPAGVAELHIEHDDLSSTDILDWGLDDPAGFRGWGGGNGEPIVVNAQAASRSYRAGPITPGRWHVVIGKAQITGASRAYRLRVTLRDAPTLAPQPERRPYAPSPPLSSEARWYAGDLHVHSRESGDASPTLDALATFARAQGLDFIELSDHNTTAQLDFIVDAQARHPALLLLPGVEFTTYDGHANGIGATAWVDHKIGQPGVTIEAAADTFHAQGALFSINHPVFDLGDLCIGCAWKHALPFDRVDAVEIATAGAGPLFSAPSLAFWDAMLDGNHHVAPVGGSDDHRAGQDLGPFGTPVGTPATYVLADALSADAIVRAIRAGRTVVKLLGPSDPMVELTSPSAPGGIAQVGDTIRADTAALHARITGGAGLAVRWVVNGRAEPEQPIASDPFELTRDVTAPPPGVSARYRVEVLRDGIPTTITNHLWIERGSAAEGDGCGCTTARPRAPTAALVLLTVACALVLRRPRRSAIASTF